MWGLASLLPFPLQGFRLVATGFRHKKCQLLLLSRGLFLCDVMSNPLQNYECNISPRMVSHVNKFDEIKGSNLKRIWPYLHFSKTN